MRDITRVVFHIPPIAWAVLGVGVLAARIEGGNQLLCIQISRSDGPSNDSAKRGSI